MIYQSICKTIYLIKLFDIQLICPSISKWRKSHQSSWFSCCIFKLPANRRVGLANNWLTNSKTLLWLCNGRLFRASVLFLKWATFIGGPIWPADRRTISTIFVCPYQGQIVMPTLSALHYFWSSIYSVIISNNFGVSDIN